MSETLAQASAARAASGPGRGRSVSRARPWRRNRATRSALGMSSGRASRNMRRAASSESSTGGCPFCAVQRSRARACRVSARGSSASIEAPPGKALPGNAVPGTVPVGPQCAARRSCSSSAARRVKVTMAMDFGGAPDSSRRSTRASSVWVLPVPGPASTSTGARGSAWSPRPAATAASWDGFRPWRAGGEPSAGAGSPSDSVSGSEGVCMAGRRPRRAGMPASIRPWRIWARSSGVNTVMTPYSPSKPELRRTLPARMRSTASASTGAAREMSASGASRRMNSSGPRRSSRR